MPGQQRPQNRKKKQIGPLPAGRRSGESLTGLGDEEEQHDDGGDERDDAAGERPLVEVLVHLGVRVQPLEPLQERVHLSSHYSAAGGRSTTAAPSPSSSPPDPSSREHWPAETAATRREVGLGFDRRDSARCRRGRGLVGVSKQAGRRREIDYEGLRGDIAWTR